MKIATLDKYVLFHKNLINKINLKATELAVNLTVCIIAIRLTKS